MDPCQEIIIQIQKLNDKIKSMETKSNISNENNVMNQFKSFEKQLSDYQYIYMKRCNLFNSYRSIV